MTKVNCAIIGSGNSSTDLLSKLVTPKRGLVVRDLLVAVGRRMGVQEDIIEDTAIDMRSAVR